MRVGSAGRWGHAVRICLLADATCVHTQRIARGLAARGHFVRVVSHKTEYIRDVVVDKFVVPNFSLRYPTRWHRRRSLYVSRLMRSHDIVHMNFLSDWGVTAEIAAAGCLVASPWGSDIVRPPDLPAYPEGLPALRRRLLQLADAVVVYGRPFVEVVASFGGLSAAEILSVPLGVDVRTFTPSEDMIRRPCTVGFFKGFKAVYGPDIWIEAIPRVLEAVPQARFDLVGRGPMLEGCRARVDDLGVQHAVNWVPYQPHEAVPEMLGSWSLSVMPSVSEAFGVAALECAAMRTPVVASRVCGFLETVRDGETGLLVEPGDVRGLADAVTRLLSDEALRTQMGAAGRAMVIDEFDWPGCLDQLVAAYEVARERHHACPLAV